MLYIGNIAEKKLYQKLRSYSNTKIKKFLVTVGISHLYVSLYRKHKIL